MISLDELIKKADDRIGFGLDICNGENEIAEQIGIGFYMVYQYNHSEEEMWTFVTLDNEEEAKILAEYWANEYCTDDDERQFREEYYVEGVSDHEEFEEFMKQSFSEFNEKASWDLPIRVGQSIAFSTTVGYGFIDDVLKCMPLKALQQFTASLFESSIITGGMEDH